MQGVPGEVITAIDAVIAMQRELERIAETQRAVQQAVTAAQLHSVVTLQVVAAAQLHSAVVLQAAERELARPLVDMQRELERVIADGGRSVAIDFDIRAQPCSRNGYTPLLPAKLRKRLQIEHGTRKALKVLRYLVEHGSKKAAQILMSLAPPLDWQREDDDEHDEQPAQSYVLEVEPSRYLPLVLNPQTKPRAPAA